MSGIILETGPTALKREKFNLTEHVNHLCIVEMRFPNKTGEMKVYVNSVLWIVKYHCATFFFSSV